MAVTIYRSTDVGAPALPANSNYVKASFFMDIIKQCLVTGYGTQPAAGWTLRYEDTTANKRRLAVSNGNGVMEFITWGTNSIAMVMWDSITTPGVGRLFDDSFASVMSAGVNGWKSQSVAAPGIEGENIAGIGLNSINSSYTESIAWTVFADNKSAWILFHYPSGNSNASGSSSLNTHSLQHPQMFFGALKSPDLDKNQLGNLFLLYPQRLLANTANITASGVNSLSYFWGLRTPNNTVPATANNSEFNLSYWGEEGSALASGNPYGSVRILIPAGVSYLGTDVVKPAGLTFSNAYYLFATIPGLAQFADPSASTEGRNYWRYLNAERGATWNMQTYSVNGIDWMPWTLSGGNNVRSNYGITNDAAWWC